MNEELNKVSEQAVNFTEMFLRRLYKCNDLFQLRELFDTHKKALDKLRKEYPCLIKQIDNTKERWLYERADSR